MENTNRLIRSCKSNDRQCNDQKKKGKKKKKKKFIPLSHMLFEHVSIKLSHVTCSHNCDRSIQIVRAAVVVIVW